MMSLLTNSCVTESDIAIFSAFFLFCTVLLQFSSSDAKIFAGGVGASFSDGV